MKETEDYPLEKVIKRFNIILSFYLLFLLIVHVLPSSIKNHILFNYLIMLLGFSGFIWASLEHNYLSKNKIYYRFIVISILFLLIGKYFEKIELFALTEFFTQGINMMIYFLIFQRIFRIIYLKIYKIEPILDRSANAFYTVGIGLCTLICSVLFKI